MAYYKRLRAITLIITALILFAAVLSVILFPENLGPKGIVSFSWSIGLLAAYLIFCNYIPRIVNTEASKTAIDEGTRFGTICGLLWMIHISMEHFVNFPGNLNGTITLSFMLLNFILFGIAAYFSMQKTGKFTWSLLAAIWCAMFSILLLILYAIVLTLVFTGHIEQNLMGEFTKSGMHDIKSYVVNNLLESGSTHLFEAPVIAAVFGSILIGIWKLKDILLKSVQ